MCDFNIPCLQIVRISEYYFTDDYYMPERDQVIPKDKCGDGMFQTVIIIYLSNHRSLHALKAIPNFCTLWPIIM